MGVAGHEKVMTINGYVPICELVDRSVILWNGSGWYQAKIRLIKKDQPLCRIHISNRATLTCSYPNQFCVGNCYESGTSMPIIRSHFYKLSVSNNHEVPLNESIVFKIPWLAKQFDKNANFVQITYFDTKWLSEIQLLANTLGTSPFITSSSCGFHLRFSTDDVYILTDQLNLSLAKPVSSYDDVESQTLTVSAIGMISDKADIYGTDISQSTLVSGVYINLG